MKQIHQWSILYIVCFCTACYTSNDNTVRQTNTAPVVDSIIQTSRKVAPKVKKVTDALAKKQDTIKSKHTAIVHQNYPPPDFSKVKPRCKFINPAKFEMSWKMVREFKQVKEADFYSLGLDALTKGDAYTNKFIDIFYYAFLENLNGNVGVIFFHYGESSSLHLVCFVYDQKGKMLDHKKLEMNFGDMGAIAQKKGQFDNDSTYKFEYKYEHLGEKVVYEWYKSRLFFSKSGKIIPGDTTFIVKPKHY